MNINGWKRYNKREKGRTMTIEGGRRKREQRQERERERETGGERELEERENKDKRES